MRGNLDLAHTYLKEANSADPNNLSIQTNYVRILKAIRTSLNDPVLEDHLSSNYGLSRRDTGFSAALHGEQHQGSALFFSEYLRAINMFNDASGEATKGLAQQLQDRSMPASDIDLSRRQGEWSYLQTADDPAVIELDHTPQTANTQPQRNNPTEMLVELPDLGYPG